MKLLTTFCPSKIVWELTAIASEGKFPSNNWQKQLALIEESLILLKQSGIAGIRLVLFPSELTNDGNAFRFEPLTTMLSVTDKLKMEVILCVGPFQYPYYPGIY